MTNNENRLKKVIISILTASAFLSGCGAAQLQNTAQNVTQNIIIKQEANTPNFKVQGEDKESSEEIKQEKNEPVILKVISITPIKK